MYFRTLVFLVLLFLAKNIFAQQSLLDTIKVAEVEITASKIESFAIGGNIQKIQAKIIQNSETESISTLLSKHSSVIINSYGIGGVSSPIIRGGGSSHTAVMWNGMNLQSPLTGGVNLSLMPVFMFDNISIQYGGSATLFGSGNVNGAVHLNSSNILKTPNNTSILLSYGSFNNRILALSTKIGNNKIASTFKIYTQLVDNNFKFLNIAKINSPIDYQTHAGLYQHGISNETMFKTSKKSFLKSSFWYQYYDKDLQTLMTNSDTSRSNQKDKVLRYSLNWQHFGEKSSWNLNSGFLNDNLHYVDSDIAIAESNISSYSFINEIENKLYLFRNHSLNTGINYSHEIGDSEGLNSLIKRNRISLFSTYHLLEFNKKLNAVFSFRSEFVDDKFIPAIYSFGTDYNLGILKIKGNISKNYRLPTFNDLYWKANKYTSGNINLNPESGISGNIGFDNNIRRDKFQMRFSKTFFYSHLNDWIVWLPNDLGVWTPENKKEGINKGFESELSFIFKNKESLLNLICNYTITKSESVEYIDGEKIVKTSLYVPNHKLMFFMFYTFKSFNISYVHNYFGKRFYDNVHCLESYQIGDFNLSFNKKINNNELVCSFKLANVWNKNYQVIAWYAMPLRSYQISIKYKFNK